MMTHGQRNALIRLKGLHDSFPRQLSFRAVFLGYLSAPQLRKIESTGFVKIDKSSGVFRYSITDAGRKELER